MLVLSFVFFRGFHRKTFFLCSQVGLQEILLSIFLHFSIKSEDLSEREIIAIESLVIVIRTQQISLISGDL